MTNQELLIQIKELINKRLYAQAIELINKNI